jgi:RHS repeat-associated protein
VDTLRYDASGVLTAESNPSGGEGAAGGGGVYPGLLPRYAGYEWDNALGLYHVGARWYDPSQGRWLSRDPLSLAADSNPYRYVRNQSTTRSDPNGEGGVWEFLAPIPIVGTISNGIRILAEQVPNSHLGDYADIIIQSIALRRQWGRVAADFRAVEQIQIRAGGTISSFAKGWLHHIAFDLVPVPFLIYGGFGSAAVVLLGDLAVNSGLVAEQVSAVVAAADAAIRRVFAL